MAFYTIFGFALFFSGRNRLLAIILGVFILQKLVPMFGAPWDFFKNKIVFEFLFGISVAVIYRRGLLNNITKTFSFLLLLLAMIIIATKGRGHDYLYTGVPCTLIVIAALSQEKLFQRHSCLILLGNWSYSTYLCHMLVLSEAYYLFETYHLTLELILIIVITGVFVISMASYSLIESCASKWLKEKLKFVLKPDTLNKY